MRRPRWFAKFLGRAQKPIDLSTDEGCVKAVEEGVLQPHEAPMALIREEIKRTNEENLGSRRR